MNYYEMNMNCVLKYKSYLYESIQRKIEHRTCKQEEIRMIDAKDGSTALCVKREGMEHRLNSFYYPQKEAEQWSQQYNIKNLQSVILMFGLGNGLFTRALNSRKDEGSYLFVYEPSFELFYFVIHNYDITDIIKDNSIFLLIDDIEENTFFSSFEGHLSITNIQSQIWCIHPKYNEIYESEYLEFMHKIKEHNHHALLEINTKKHFALRYVNNTIKNLRYLPDSNRLLDYKTCINTDIPALILAAGPSLREHIDDIKGLKGKAYIFVVDRILDYALKHGVEPDFIVTIDPIKPLEQFTDVENLKIPLICYMNSNWEILKFHKGRKIIACADEYVGKLYYKLKEIPPYMRLGNSVATVAFSACEQLGFKVIILAGQDLAYDGETTHVGGESELIGDEKEIYVEGIDGNQVRSRWDWYEFLRWYKSKIEENDSVVVIDMKSRGAKIPGTKNMSFEEVQRYYLNHTFDPKDLAKIKPTFTKRKKESLRRQILNGYKELEIIEKKITKAIDLCERQIKGYKKFGQGTNSYRLRFDRITKINKEVHNRLIYGLLEYIVLSKSILELSKLYQIHEEEKEDVLLAYESSIHIYKAILEAIVLIRPLLEGCISESDG